MRTKTIPVLAILVAWSAARIITANDIEPTKDKYTAIHTGGAITLDGNLNDWTGVPVLADPKFAIVLGKEGTGAGKGGGGADGNYVLFEQYAGGTWSGPNDQTSAVQVAWDADNVYFGFVVTDDYHENMSGNAWNGDSIQLMIANGTRDAQVALYDYALGGYEDDKTTPGKLTLVPDPALTDQVMILHESRPPDQDPACTTCDTTAIIKRDSVNKKTFYEIKLPAASLGLTAPLTAGTQFGLGMAINDGDGYVDGTSGTSYGQGASQQGQKGWGGLGAHSIVFGKTASETALITLSATTPGADKLFFSAINPTLTSFSFRATDKGVSIVNPSTAKLTINGQVFALTASPKVGDATDFKYSPAAPFAAPSTNTYAIEVKDTTGATVTDSGTFILATPNVFAPGFLKREFFPGAVRADVEAGTIAPASITALPTFESPSNVADNYAQRVSGFFTPSVSGDYVFFIATDDDGDLFLSTDSDPVNKKLIAQESGWSGVRSWVAVGGGSVLEDKRSDSFSLSEWPTPNQITLTAGNRYYIEAVEHEGGGGDNLAVYIKLAADPDPANGDAPSAAGGAFGFSAPAATSTITQQPQNITVTEGKTGSLSASGTTTSTFGIAYQWKLNGTNIPGATSSTYTLPVQKLANSGAKYTVVVSAAGADAVESSAATVTVVTDTTPPQVTSAGSLKNFADGTEVGVLFDEALNPASVTALSNYTLSGGATVTAARYVTNSSGLNSLQQGVILSVNGVTPGNTYTLTVKGVADAKNNAIATAQTVTFTASTLNWVSLGVTVNGVRNDAIALGTNGFNLVNGGNAFWNAEDDITMVYETISGDFDKTAQVEWNDPSSNWARAGISARESLNNGGITTDAAGDNPASRYQMIISDPATKFDGTAANDAYETNRRLNPGVNTTSSNGSGAIVTYPDSWVRLKRVGQMISMLYSKNGNSWQVLGTTDFGDATVSDTPLPNDLFVGPTLGVENGNITGQGGTTNQQGAFAARLRNYGSLPQKPRGGATYSIGLNLGANEAGAQLSTKDVAGAAAVAQSNWNNIFGNDTAGVPVTGIVADKAGASTATPVTVEVGGSGNTWSSQGPRGEENGVNLTGEDQILMTGYVDSGNATTTQVKISNIPTDLASAGYDVVLYMLGGAGNRGGGYRVTDSTGAVLAGSVLVNGSVNPTNLTQAVANGTNQVTGSYLVFKNLKATNIIVEASTENGLGFDNSGGGTPRAPLNAVQLVTPSGLIGTVANKPTLSIAKNGANTVITFTGRLQSAATITGTFTDVAGATSPFTVTIPAGAGAKFYRAAQ